MTERKLKISILSETFSICRLEKDEPLPAWVLGGAFFSVTRTEEELSIVCPEVLVPKEVKREDGWKCLKVEGPLDFSLTGILASLTMPLAEKKIGVFSISTFDTDYLLVKKEDLETAIHVLALNGFIVGADRPVAPTMRSTK